MKKICNEFINYTKILLNILKKYRTLNIVVFLIVLNIIVFISDNYNIFTNNVYLYALITIIIGLLVILLLDIFTKNNVELKILLILIIIFEIIIYIIIIELQDYFQNKCDYINHVFLKNTKIDINWDYIKNLWLVRNCDIVKKGIKFFLFSGIITFLSFKFTKLIIKNTPITKYTKKYVKSAANFYVKNETENPITLGKLMKDDFTHDQLANLFISDVELENIKYDLFNRAQLLLNITEAIKESNGKTIIGINGGWGTGKTTINNMIINELSDNYVILRNFDFLNYSDERTMVKGLIEEIAKKLNLVHSNSMLITNYVDSLFNTKLSLTKMLNLFYKGDICVEINDYLKRTNKKIVVFVENIDRLFNKEKISMFYQIICSRFNIENIIFVVSFKDIEIDGKSYNILGLNKFFDHVFEVSSVEDNINYTSLFMKAIKRLCDIYEIKFGKDIENVLSLMKDENIFNNFRDIIKLLNQLLYYFKNGTLSISDAIIINYYRMFHNDKEYENLMKELSKYKNKYFTSNICNYKFSQYQEEDFYADYTFYGIEDVYINPAKVDIKKNYLPKQLVERIGKSDLNNIDTLEILDSDFDDDINYLRYFSYVVGKLDTDKLKEYIDKYGNDIYNILTSKSIKKDNYMEYNILKGRINIALNKIGNTFERFMKNNLFYETTR